MRFVVPRVFDSTLNKLTRRFHEHPQNLHICYQYQPPLLSLWAWKVLKSCTEKLFALTTFTITQIRSSKNARLGSLVLRPASFPIHRHHKTPTFATWVLQLPSRVDALRQILLDFPCILCESDK